MNHEVYLISVFGFLLAAEKAGYLKIFSNQRGIVPFIIQGFHLIWQGVLLICFFSFAVEKYLPAGQVEEWGILILFPAAFLAGRFEKKSPFFFLTTFSISLYVVTQKGHLDLIGKAGIGLYLSFGIILFEILLLGLIEKLEFSYIPKQIKGLPLLFFCGALVLMAFWSLQGILNS